MRSAHTDSKLLSRIASYLETRADLRDSDSRLVTLVWRDEATAAGHDLDKMTAMEFLKLLRTETLTNHESIVRARRKVQEQNAALRGTKYSRRHEKEVEVRTFFGGHQ